MPHLSICQRQRIIRLFKKLNNTDESKKKTLGKVVEEAKNKDIFISHEGARLIIKKYEYFSKYFLNVSNINFFLNIIFDKECVGNKQKNNEKKVKLTEAAKRRYLASYRILF